MTLTTSGGSWVNNRYEEHHCKSKSNASVEVIISDMPGATSGAMGGSVGGGATGGTWRRAGSWTNATDVANATY